MPTTLRTCTALLPGLLALAATLVGPTAARADTLYGRAVTTALYFPDYGTVRDTTPAGAPYTVVAGPADPDLRFADSAQFEIDFQPDRIVIHIDDRACCTSGGSFNGLSFRLGAGQWFDAASLQSTNVPGFDASRVWLHSPNELLVSLGGGLNLDPSNSTIVLAVSAVPEPPAALLMALGLGGLLVARRCRAD